MRFDLLSIVLTLYGLFTLYGVILRPNFYWERGRIRRTRELIGDNKTRALYLITGVVMFGVGIWGLFFVA